MLASLKGIQLVYHQSITRKKHRLIKIKYQNLPVIIVVESSWDHKTGVKGKVTKNNKQITVATYQ